MANRNQNQRRSRVKRTNTLESLSGVFLFPKATRTSTNEEGCYGNYAALAGRSDIVQPVNNQGVKRWHNVIDELINPFSF